MALTKKLEALRLKKLQKIKTHYRIDYNSLHIVKFQRLGKAIDRVLYGNKISKENEAGVRGKGFPRNNSSSFSLFNRKNLVEEKSRNKFEETEKEKIEIKEKGVKVSFESSVGKLTGRVPNVKIDRSAYNKKKENNVENKLDEVQFEQKKKIEEKKGKNEEQIFKKNKTKRKLQKSVISLDDDSVANSELESQLQKSNLHNESQVYQGASLEDFEKENSDRKEEKISHQETNQSKRRARHIDKNKLEPEIPKPIVKQIKSLSQIAKDTKEDISLINDIQFLNKKIREKEDLAEREQQKLDQKKHELSKGIQNLSLINPKSGEKEKFNFDFGYRSRVKEIGDSLVNLQKDKNNTRISKFSFAKNDDSDFELDEPPLPNLSSRSSYHSRQSIYHPILQQVEEDTTQQEIEIENYYEQMRKSKKSLRRGSKRRRTQPKPKNKNFKKKSSINGEFADSVEVLRRNGLNVPDKKKNDLRNSDFNTQNQEEVPVESLIKSGLRVLDNRDQGFKEEP